MKLWERVVKAVERFKPAPTKTIANPGSLSPYDIAGTGPTWRDFLDEAIQRNAQDKIMYADFDEMDNDVPEISISLDVTADFIVYPSNTDKSEVFKVTSKKYDDKLREIDKTLNIHHEMFGMIREMLKYGDNLEEIRRTIAVGKLPGRPLGFKNIPIESAVLQVRNGEIDPTKYLSQINPMTQKELVSLPLSDVFHLSLASNRKRYTQYRKGVSRLQKARLIYRQVRLMEEGAMIRRLSRANNNYAILVDVGDSSGDETLDYLDKYRKRITRRKYVDQSTGKFSYRTNPLSIIEDLYLPTRQGSNAGVVSLNQGSNGDTNVGDLEYFQNKMIYATGTPKLLIGKEQDVNAKSTSDVQMISFYRDIRRIQTMIEPALITFYQNALASFGITDADDLVVYWPVCGTIDEERKWRIEQLKWQVAAVISQDLALVDDYYLYKNFMGLDDEQIKTLTTRMDTTEQKISQEVGDIPFEDEPEEEEPNVEEPPEEGEEEIPDNETPDEREQRVYETLAKNCKTKKEKTQLRTFVKAVITDAHLRNTVAEILELAKLKNV